MKIIFKQVLPLLVILTGCTPIIYTTSQPAYTDQALQGYADLPQTTQVFYDELSPYGQWIDYPDYGYVWQPNVDADFRPYDTNGNWVYSDYGWTWVSDYSWGWAPFHYGRWFYDGNYGWLWAPGNQWAPAWVTWGQSGNYYGWAPIPPRADINRGWRPGNNDWSYVDARHIATVNVHNYVVRNNVTVVNNTAIINNINTGNGNGRTGMILYNRGPRSIDVENTTHTSIQPVKINESPRPGQSLSGGQLTVYRPAIRQNIVSGNTAPAPQKVIAYRQNGNQGNFHQNPQRDQPAPGMGNGQRNDQNPAQPQLQPGQGQGNTPTPNQQYQRPGNNQNFNQPQIQPDQSQRNNPNQQHQRPDNRPNNNQNLLQPLVQPGQGQGNTPTPNQQYQRPGNRQDNIQNLVQPQVQPNQGRNNNPQQNQPNPRPGNGQNNLPTPNMQLLKQRELMNQQQNLPVQQQAKPVATPNPAPQPQIRPVQAPNLPAQPRPMVPKSQPIKTNNQPPPEKKVTPPPPPVKESN
jgi:hypothetical protein